MEWNESAGRSWTGRRGEPEVFSEAGAISSLTLRVVMTDLWELTTDN
jgi:hypothetical protein